MNSVKQTRVDFGLSQDIMAILLDTNRGYLSMIETDHREIPADISIRHGQLSRVLSQSGPHSFRPEEIKWLKEQIVMTENELAKPLEKLGEELGILRKALDKLQQTEIAADHNFSIIDRVQRSSLPISDDQRHDLETERRLIIQNKFKWIAKKSDLELKIRQKEENIRTINHMIKFVWTYLPD